MDGADGDGATGDTGPVGPTGPAGADGEGGDPDPITLVNAQGIGAGTSATQITLPNHLRTLRC